MQELYSEIEIEATAEQVWRILTDFAAFPQWNPFILHASGDVEPGARLEVYLKPPGGSGMTFRPTVLKAAPNHEFRWLGRLFIPGLFDGEHIFTIESTENHRVCFVQREQFTGLLVPLLLRIIGTDTQRGFAAMNQALKEEAEKIP